MFKHLVKDPFFWVFVVIITIMTVIITVGQQYWLTGLLCSMMVNIGMRLGMSWNKGDIDKAQKVMNEYKDACYDHYINAKERREEVDSLKQQLKDQEEITRKAFLGITAQVRDLQEKRDVLDRITMTKEQQRQQQQNIKADLAALTDGTPRVFRHQPDTCECTDCLRKRLETNVSITLTREQRRRLANNDYEELRKLEEQVGDTVLNPEAFIDKCCEAEDRWRLSQDDYDYLTRPKWLLSGTTDGTSTTPHMHVVDGKECTLCQTHKKAIQTVTGEYRDKDTFNALTTPFPNVYGLPKGTSRDVDRFVETYARAEEKVRK